MSTRLYLHAGDAAQAPDAAAAVARILDRLERGKRATADELAVLRAGVAALQAAPRRPLSDAERSFLAFALDCAAAELSLGRGFVADDITAIAALRALAGGAGS